MTTNATPRATVYREHQPMTPAERRALSDERRAWLHSQEARDMGEAPPGYGWSYNDEDDGS